MTRQELYDLVWSSPVSTAAKQFGISDKTLALKCSAIKVPIPPRGYWAKVAAGEAPGRTPMIDAPEAEAKAASLLKGLTLVPVHQEQVAAVDEPNAESSWPFPNDGESVSDFTARTKRPARARAMSDDCSDIARALDAEVDRAVAAGIDLQRRQAVAGLLNEVALRALEMDPASCRLLLSWARTVCQRLDESDPVSGVIAAVKLAAIDGATSQWRL